MGYISFLDFYLIMNSGIELGPLAGIYIAVLYECFPVSLK